MEEQKQKSDVWAIIGKATAIATLLGVIIAAAGGVTSIFDRFYPDKARIESSGKFVTFEYPKSMIKDVAIYNISDSPLREFHILQVLPDSVKTNPAVSADIYNAVNSLIERRNYALKNLLAVRSYWRFSVKNTGGKEASDVKIHLAGYKGYFALNEKRETETGAEFEDVVSIGNIRPQDETIVEVWTTGDYVPDIAWKTVNISTPDGAVKPVFINEIDRDSFAGFAEKFWRVAGYVALILITMFFTRIFFTRKQPLSK